MEVEACPRQEAQHPAVGAGSQGAAEGEPPLGVADARALGAAAPELVEGHHASEEAAPAVLRPAAAATSPDRALQQQRCFQNIFSYSHTTHAWA